MRRRPFHFCPKTFDCLEERFAPAVASFAAGVWTVTYAQSGAANEAVNIASDGTTILLTGDVAGDISLPAASVRRIVLSDLGGGGNQAVVIGGTAELVLLDGFASSGIETFTVNQAITIGAAGAFDGIAAAVVINNPLTLASGPLSLSATDGIAINAAVATNGGAATLNADRDGNGIGTLSLAAGIVGTWTSQGKVADPGGASLDIFGQSVAISADGNTAVVGAPRRTVTRDNQGVAFVFKRTGSTWTQQQMLVNPAVTGAEDFGEAVALSADGATILIGAPGNRVGANGAQGSVFIFKRNGSNFTYSQSLTDPAGLSGDGIGGRIALSGDGDTALVYGSYSNALANQGGVLVLVRNGATWSLQEKIVPPVAYLNGVFGGSLALSTDGNTALVGAAGDTTDGIDDRGATYVYARSAGVWSLQQKLLSVAGASGAHHFGSAVALSGDGNTAAIGAVDEAVFDETSSGTVSIFVRRNGVWTRQHRLLSSNPDADMFGQALAMSRDGLTLVVGSQDKINGITGQGAATVFVRSGENWLETQRLVHADPAAFEEMGWAVAISDEGTILSSADDDNFGASTHRGSATLFKLSGAGSGGGIVSAGAVFVSAADLDLGGSISANGLASFSVSQDNRPLDLGTNTAGAFGLSAAEFKKISATSLRIGNSASGSLSLSAPILQTSSADLELRSGNAIVFNKRLNVYTPLLLAPGPGGVSFPNASRDIVLSDAPGAPLRFASGSQLVFSLTNTTADTGFERLWIRGYVDLAGASLKLNSSLTPTSTSSFAVIRNSIATPDPGSLDGLGNGSFFASEGNRYLLTYTYNSTTQVTVRLQNPVVSSASPLIGPTNGELVVTIVGLRLTGVSAVYFAGTPALSFTVTSDTQITATAPMGSGLVAVTVINQGVTSSVTANSNFTYPAPAIAAIEVNGGPALILASGGSISLQGQNSVVRQILVTFNQAVSVASDAFTVTPRTTNVTVHGGAAPSSLPVVASVSPISSGQYLITFSGPGAPNGVIRSGVYDLKGIAAKITANGASMAADQSFVFFAMFGDIAAHNSYTAGTLGDGQSNAFVDPGSLFEFSDHFGARVDGSAGPAYSVTNDANLDGAIDPGDLFAFSDSFGIHWTF